MNHTTKPKFDTLEDAERLRAAASILSYNDSAVEAHNKHALNEIAMRLQTGGYAPAPAMAPSIHEMNAATLQGVVSHLRAMLGLADGDSLNDAVLALLPGWRPIATAPRDGTDILIRFGTDGTSQGKYVPGAPYPWRFIDTNGVDSWILNAAVDGPGGPSHWMPMPADNVKPRKDAQDKDKLEDGAESQVRDLITAMLDVEYVAIVQGTYVERTSAPVTYEGLRALFLAGVDLGAASVQVKWPVLKGVAREAAKLTPWRNVLSYNDSYFGEPAGLLKQVVAQFDRLLPLESGRTERVQEAPVSQVSAAAEGVRDAVWEAVQQSIGDAYDCTRAWSAWGCNTMSEDDFHRVADQPDRVDEIVAAVFKSLPASVSKVHTWSDMDAIAEDPKVFEALQDFSADPTGDGAVVIVEAMLNALGLKTFREWVGIDLASPIDAPAHSEISHRVVMDLPDVAGLARVVKPGEDPFDGETTEEVWLVSGAETEVGKFLCIHANVSGQPSEDAKILVDWIGFLSANELIDSTNAARVLVNGGWIECTLLALRRADSMKVWGPGFMCTLPENNERFANSRSRASFHTFNALLAGRVFFSNEALKHQFVKEAKDCFLDNSMEIHYDGVGRYTVTRKTHVAPIFTTLAMAFSEEGGAA